MFTFPIRVYYENTDAGGVVYHSQYLNFMERARTEWLRSLGYTQHVLRRDHGVIFVVHSLQIQYLKPACLDDALLVHCQPVTIGRSSVVCQQQIVRESQRLIDATVKIACVEAERFKPVAIPHPIKTAMEFA